jgi:hypothetical protein
MEDWTFRSSVLMSLNSYWEGLRGTAVMPPRERLDPIEIPRLLAHLALVETAPALSDFRFRVWGTELTRVFGEDRSWRRFGALNHIENWQDVFAPYGRVAETGVPELTEDRIVASDRAHLTYQRLMLPFGEGAGRVSHVLAGFAFMPRDPEPGEAGGVAP